MTLEEELGGLLATLGLAARQRRAVSRRLGWDGRPPGTLADAGDACGYTRERVRQLEERAIDRVARTRPRLPLTSAAVALLSDATPTPRTDAAVLLAERGLSRDPFDPAGVLHAARLAGIAVDVVARRRTVLRHDDVVLSPVVETISRKLARRDGAATPTAVAALTGLRELRVRRLLELGGEVRWLADTGWFTFLPFTGAVAAMVRKLLAADASARDLQLALPLDVTEALLALVPRGRLSDTEHAVVAALRQEGGSASVRSLTRLVEPTGVTRTTLAVCLSRSPLFRRVERGRWALAIQRTPDPTHGLRDPLLVLDQREADVALTVRAEAAPR
jgi:Sigma-70, region 4